MWQRAFRESKILEDRALAYVGRVGESLSCRVRLYQTGSTYVLVVTDLGDRVTRTIDLVATLMVRRWEMEPKSLVVIEHYDYRHAARADGELAETFAVVSFDWHRGVAMNPFWQSTTRGDVELLTGSTLW